MGRENRYRYWRHHSGRHCYPPWWYPEVNIPPPPNEDFYDIPERGPVPPRRLSKEDEMKMLEEEEMMLREDLEALKKRKDELRKEVK